MQFSYTFHYRDQLEAARVTFPGDATPARPRPTLLALVAFGVLAAGVYVLLSRVPAVASAAAPSAAADGAEMFADPMEHPVFGVGAIVTALGGALYVVPLAYVIGMRRSARPVHEGPLTVSLDERGVTIGSTAKDFSLAWQGVVAVSESRRLFVLKTVGDLRLALPKRALEEAEDVDALRNLLRQRVPAMAGVAAA